MDGCGESHSSIASPCARPWTCALETEVFGNVEVVTRDDEVGDGIALDGGTGLYLPWAEDRAGKVPSLLLLLLCWVEGSGRDSLVGQTPASIVVKGIWGS